MRPVSEEVMKAPGMTLQSAIMLLWKLLEDMVEPESEEE